MADKPGHAYPESCTPIVLEDDLPYVSRGGLKLKHALDTFNVSPKGQVVLDIGSSTGGFADCVLQEGAKTIFAVDVGYGQLDWKIREHPRVVVMERTNARYLKPEDLDVTPNLAVIDVSFISLKKILPAVFDVLDSEGQIIALVKPQFEVGKDQMENKGIIKSPQKHVDVLSSLSTFLTESGWHLTDLTASPILGQKGNREFLIHGTAQATNKNVSTEDIKRVVFDTN